MAKPRVNHTHAWHTYHASVGLEYILRGQRTKYHACVKLEVDSTIDPMHNLVLGTSKRLLEKEWLENDLLSQTDLEAIQPRDNNLVVPRGVGRIPHKISSKFNSLTADEWKNWALIFSIICLHDVLPAADLECWYIFVSACRIYYSSVITTNDIDLAHR